MEFLGLAAVRGGSEQDELLVGFPGDAADQVVTLLLGIGSTCGTGTGVRLVHNDQFRTLLDKYIAPGIGFDEVDADDLVGIVVKHTGVTLDLAVEPGLGIGADDDRLDVQFVADFGLPLLAQMGQTDDGETPNFATFQQFLDDEQGFHGFAHAHVVGDEELGCVLPQSHDERHHLVGTRTEGKFCQGAERTGTVAEGKPGGIVEQASSTDVAQVCRAGRFESSVRRLIGFDAQRQVNPGDFVI